MSLATVIQDVKIPTHSRCATEKESMAELAEQKKRERTRRLFQKYFPDEVSSSLNDISHLLKQDFDLQYMDYDVKEEQKAKKQKQVVKKDIHERPFNFHQQNEIFLHRKNLWKKSFHSYIDNIEYYKKDVCEQIDVTHLVYGDYEPQFTVDGLLLKGEVIAYPLTSDHAKQLKSLADISISPRPSRVWQIDASEIRFEEDSREKWDKSIEEIVSEAVLALGIESQNYNISAEFRGIFIIEEGGEMEETIHAYQTGMNGRFASLYIQLPSIFSGGEDAITYGSIYRSFQPSLSSKNTIYATAMYSECNYTVQPITSGWRLLMSYSLVCHGKSPPSIEVLKVRDGHVHELIRDWKGIFSQPLLYMSDTSICSRDGSFQDLSNTDQAMIAFLQSFEDDKREPLLDVFLVTISLQLVKNAKTNSSGVNHLVSRPVTFLRNWIKSGKDNQSIEGFDLNFNWKHSLLLSREMVMCNDLEHEIFGDFRDLSGLRSSICYLDRGAIAFWPRQLAFSIMNKCGESGIVNCNEVTYYQNYASAVMRETFSNKLVAKMRELDFDIDTQDLEQIVRLKDKTLVCEAMKCCKVLSSAKRTRIIAEIYLSYAQSIPEEIIINLLCSTIKRINGERDQPNVSFVLGFLHAIQNLQSTSTYESIKVAITREYLAHLKVARIPIVETPFLHLNIFGVMAFQIDRNSLFKEYCRILEQVMGDHLCSFLGYIRRFHEDSIRQDSKVLKLARLRVYELKHQKLSLKEEMEMLEMTYDITESDDAIDQPSASSRANH